MFLVRGSRVGSINVRYFPVYIDGLAPSLVLSEAMMSGGELQGTRRFAMHLQHFIYMFQSSSMGNVLWDPWEVFRQVCEKLRI